MSATLRSRLCQLLRLMGVCFFGVLTLIAVEDLTGYIAETGAGGAYAPWIWRAGLLAIAALLFRFRDRWPRALSIPSTAWLGLLLLFGLRLVVSIRMDAPLISDFLEYHQLAIGLLHGGSWFSELRPMGYPLLLALAYKLGGVGPTSGEWLNVVLAVLTGIALYGLGRRSGGPAAGTLAIWIFALAPSQILTTAELGTEIAYAAVFMAAIWAAVEANTRWPLALVAGALLGLSQYVRPTSLALVPAFLLLPWLAGLDWRKLVLRLTAFVAAFVLVLAPVALYNHRVSGHWSLSTSNYGGWSLLVGTNQAHNGMWNVDDVALTARFTDLRAKNAFALREGEHRLISDPLGFVALAARKFPIMWASEDYATYWTMGTAPHPDEVAIANLNVLAQAFYVLVLLLALLGVWRKRDDAGIQLILTITGILVAVHSLLEVQSRYHYYMVPAFCLLAALGLARDEAIAQSAAPVEELVAA
ncbi:MAG TPA: glycosyltransferase family 39 protein [Oscillatoriaceae cyanobacterium]